MRWDEGHVAEESWMSLTLPIRRIIRGSFHSFAQSAQKCMFFRVDYDARVTMPHDYISGLWLGDPPKAFRTAIKPLRIRIWILKPGLLVKRVDEMCAIKFRLLHLRAQIEQKRRYISRMRAWVIVMGLFRLCPKRQRAQQDGRNC